MGGICFDTNGKCLKKWLWPDDSKSVAFHPIAFTLNEYMSIQIHSRFKIIFNFRTKVGCSRFSIGSKMPLTVEIFFSLIIKFFFNFVYYRKLQKAKFIRAISNQLLQMKIVLN